jgi:hypothetical protein
MNIFRIKLFRNKGKVVRIKMEVTLSMVVSACNPSDWEVKIGECLSIKKKKNPRNGWIYCRILPKSLKKDSHQGSSNCSIKYKGKE